MNLPRVNDGDGLFDDVGLCGMLLKLLDHIEIKGSSNIQNMLLVINGLEKIEKRLREIRDEKDEAEATMEKEVSVNDNGHPVIGGDV